MKWLIRPAMLVVVAGILIGSAALVSPRGEGLTRPIPLAVADGDREVAWISLATNTTSWERFVGVVRRAQARLAEVVPDLEVEDGKAFPYETTAVPEVALAWAAPNAAGVRARQRVVFRWYKLTGAWKAEAWVEALMERSPAPLAVIGGENSRWARELAIQLNEWAPQVPVKDRPLLLITNATADEVKAPARRPAPAPAGAEQPAPPGSPQDQHYEYYETVGLHSIYKDRTFRFCFTNTQIASAVTSFIWATDELRPTADRFHTVQWEDDPYSRSLVAGFHTKHGEAVAEWARQIEAAAQTATLVAVAGQPFAPFLGLAVQAIKAQAEEDWRNAGRIQGAFFNPLRIESSVGTYGSPNIWEADAVRSLLEILLQEPTDPANPAKTLLVVGGQSLPTRRVLRELARSAPVTARRCVVAAGDVLSFNAVYRDRRISWPIQDMPYSVVFFCHCNPIAKEAGFFEEGAGDVVQSKQATSGTEDQLREVQIVESLVRCLDKGCADAEELARRMKELRWTTRPTKDGGVNGAEGNQSGWLTMEEDKGSPLFRPDGQRNSSTGEHIVYVQPCFDKGTDRVLPLTVIEVWAWGTRPVGKEDPTRIRVWRRVGDPLEVSYVELPEQGGVERGN